MFTKWQHGDASRKAASRELQVGGTSAGWRYVQVDYAQGRAVRSAGSKAPSFNCRMDLRTYKIRKIRCTERRSMIESVRRRYVAPRSGPLGLRTTSRTAGVPMSRSAGPGTRTRRPSASMIGVDDISVVEVAGIRISGTFRVGYQIMSHMRGFLAAGLSVALVCVSAEQRTAPRASKTAAPAPPKAGAVSGRVFAVTEGGDLKPNAPSFSIRVSY